MGDPEVARVVVDGIPGRIVEIPTTVKRETNRRRRYLQVRWSDVERAAKLLNTDHATRLWLIVVLQTRLDRPNDGWVKPRKQLLDGVGLPRHLRDVIARLERSGAVLVRRRSGKRALLKLVDSEHNPAGAT